MGNNESMVSHVSLFHGSKASWLFVPVTAVTAVTVRSVVVKLCQRSLPPGGDGWLLLSPWGQKCPKFHGFVQLIFG